MLFGRGWVSNDVLLAVLDAYIAFLIILGTIVIAPPKNIAGIDAFFFAVTASTTTGLNTLVSLLVTGNYLVLNIWESLIDTFSSNSVDVKELKLYQQLAVYFLPLLANLQVINTAVVFVRLHWFEKRFKDIGTSSMSPSHYFNCGRSQLDIQCTDVTTVISQSACRVNHQRVGRN